LIGSDRTFAAGVAVLVPRFQRSDYSTRSKCPTHGVICKLAAFQPKMSNA
jgi:hypothetical protein